MSPVSQPRPSIPARLAAGLVRVYQLVLSPMQALFGPCAGCRFTLGCSEYARQALLTHGFFRGSWLAIRRLSRCHPFHPGGEDPVPAPRQFMAGRMWRPPVQS